MKIYTIKDVARLAGVSVTTVSRVLNHRPDVKPDTRERVERVMAECHFVGNANARGLKQADTEVIAMILRGRQNTFLHSLAGAILHHAETLPAVFLPVYIDERDDEFATAMHLFHEKRVTGFVFLGSCIDERVKALNGVDVPMVVVTADARGTRLERAASVSVDDRRMGYAAMKELLDRGHRKIAIFGGGKRGSDPMALRYLGAGDACREAGLTLDDTRCLEVKFTMDNAYDAAKAFFAEKPDTTAVFCMSDLLAAGVIRALRDLGRRVPQDVSIFGFDGMEMGQYFIPSISTVVQPVDELARQTVAVLGDLLRGAAPSHVTVAAEVVVRESTSQLPDSVLRTAENAV